MHTFGHTKKSNTDAADEHTGINSMESPRLYLEGTTDSRPPYLKQQDVLREVDELSVKMTLVVSLDEDGKPAHLNNMGHAGGMFNRSFKLFL